MKFNLKLNTNVTAGNFITLFDSNFLKKQKIAGACVKKCLLESQKLLNNEKNILSKDIEKICFPIFKEFDCIPTFLNYQPKGMKPFPGAICVSINNELVHGIPSNRKIIEGDVVKVDLGATYQGAIADAARTFIFGKAKKQEHIDMVELGEKALNEAVKSIKIGQKTGVIGYNINKTVKKSQFRVITEYGGHGISFDYDKNVGVPHAFPFIENKSQINDGVTIVPGMTFAIEPLLVKGDNRTTIAQDGWTVLVDSDISVHFEHTVFITNNEVEIMA